jgi:hypothetical protein
LSSRISRTLVSCSSLSELYLPGESVSCQIQGESVGWWSNITFIASQDGGFSEGLGTSRRRRVIQGPDTSSRPLTGTGARHVTSLPPDRGATPHVAATYQGTNALSAVIRRQVFTFSDSARCSYSVEEVFFIFLFQYIVFVTAHILIHLRPGPSGVTGFMGSLLDLMSRNWGC